MAFEKYILTSENDPWKPKLDLLYFRAMLDAYVFDGKTAQECENGIEWCLNNQNIPYVLTANDKVDIVAVLQYVNADGLTDLEKMQRMDTFYRILTGARAMEGGPQANVWYGTQALLRAKFNWSAQD